MKFTVYGTPQPQGSTKAFIPKGWKRAVVTTDNSRLKPWRQQISGTAAALNHEPLHGAVCIMANFFFARPRSASRKRIHPTVRPDIDKLSRAILDGLAGILYGDDSQVVEIQARKHYGEPERVEIELVELV